MSRNDRIENTKEAIRVWLTQSCRGDKRMCLKFVNEELFDQLVEEVKQENAGSVQEPLLFNREEMEWKIT